MKTGTMFWNQLKWDLRYVWWAFAALFVLAPTQVWVEMQEFQGGFEGGRRGLSIMVWALMMLVAGVAVVLVIQKEVPFGRKEFWLTRPAGRGAVLSSKLALLGLLLVLLCISWLATPLLTGNGEWLWMFVINFAVTWSWMLVVAAVLASLSASLLRMLINAAILAAIVVGALLLKEFLAPRGYRYREVAEVLMMGWVALLPLLLAGAGLAIVVWQYLSRRAGVGMGAFAVVLIAGFLSIDRANQFTGFESLASRGLESDGLWKETKMKLSWGKPDSGEKIEVTPRGPKSEKFYTLSCSGLLEDMPRSESVENILFNGELRVDGVTVWEDWGTWGSSVRAAREQPLPMELGKFRNLKAEEGGREATVGKRREALTQRLSFVNVPKAELEKSRGKSLSYSGTARIYVQEIVPLGRVAFGEDFSLISRGISLRGRVGSRVLGDGGVSLVVEGGSLITFPFAEPLDRYGLGVFLVNAERGEFVRLGGGGSSGNTMRFLLWESDYGLFDSEKAFASVAEREAWLNGCEVRFYIREKKGSFERPVALPDIPLNYLDGWLKGKK